MVDFTTLHPFDFDRNLFNFLVYTVMMTYTPSILLLCHQDNIIVIIENSLDPLHPTATFGVCE